MISNGVSVYPLYDWTVNKAKIIGWDYGHCCQLKMLQYCDILVALSRKGLIFLTKFVTGNALEKFEVECDLISLMFEHVCDIGRYVERFSFWSFQRIYWNITDIPLFPFDAGIFN